MAVKVKVREVTASPGPRKILTDLQPGTTRKTVYQLGPVGWAAIGVGAALLAPAVGRFIFGPSPRNEAREKLATDLLLAKLQGEEAAADKIRAQTEQIRKGPTPIQEELQRVKIKAIQTALPLDLALREVRLEAEEAQLRREERIAPIILRLKEERVAIERDLFQDRSTRTAGFIETGQAKAERELAAADLGQARASQIRVNTGLIETALSGLNYWERSAFLRDRLFPKPVVAPVRRRIRVIRAF